MKSKDLKTFLTGYCRHRHKYHEHPNCFLTEQGLKIKIGYLDIETSNLAASFGIMYSYAIKDGDSKKIFGRAITKKELFSDTMDKDLVNECIDDIMKFDKIVTYYGTKFDLPFLRSRALYWNLWFPEHGVLNHRDAYYIVRSKLRLHRNRLENACDFLKIPGKTHIKYEYWIKAMQGDSTSLKYIWNHNQKDVMILQRLHERLIEYVRDTNKSI